MNCHNIELMLVLFSVFTRHTKLVTSLYLWWSWDTSVV